MRSIPWWQAAQKRHRLAVPVEWTAVEGVFLLDHARHAIGLAGKAFLLFLEVIDKSQQLFLRLLLCLQGCLGGFQIAREALEQVLGILHDRGEVSPSRQLIAAVDHAVIEAALAVKLGLLKPLGGVELFGPPLEHLEFVFDHPQIAAAGLGVGLGCLDLGVDGVDLRRVFLFLLLEFFLLGRFELFPFDQLKLALDFLPGTQMVGHDHPDRG
jgi:hypothetical protein